MSFFPVIHELITAISSAAHAVTGDTAAARKVWNDYAEKSVVGSSCYALHENINGNSQRATQLWKGAARASAGILDVSRNIPVLHELATASDSLGDVLAGEPEKAANHWDDYAERSVVGSACYSLHHCLQGDTQRAQELIWNSGKSLTKAAIETAVITASVVAGGSTFPLAGIATIGGGSSAIAHVATTAIDGNLGKLKAGDVLGSAAIGAATTTCAAAAKRHLGKRVQRSDTQNPAPKKIKYTRHGEERANQRLNGNADQIAEACLNDDGFKVVENRNPELGFTTKEYAMVDGKVYSTVFNSDGEVVTIMRDKVKKFDALR
jgi:hypothetical protein